MSNKPKIYLSYRRKQGRVPEQVSSIQNLIEQSLDYEVVLDPGRLSANADWIEHAQSIIKDCDVFCVLVASETGKSEWIQAEVKWANNLALPVLPVMIEEVNFLDELQPLDLLTTQYVTYDEAQPQTQSLLLNIIRQMAESVFGRRKRRRVILNRTERLPNYHLFQADYDQIPIVNQILGNPSDDQQFECDIFMIMPFAEPFSSIYQKKIRPIAENLNLKIKRGDDFFATHAIMTDVWSAMFRSYCVIAECTGRNANVFYELGMAHTLNKPTILLTQNIEDIPFDIRQLRHINYVNSPDGLDDLEKALESALLRLVFGEESND